MSVPISASTGRRFLTALLESDSDPEALAAGATQGLQRKRHQLTEALTGRGCEHQRFLLRQILANLEFVEQGIAALDAEVVARTRLFEAAIAIAALDQIPGNGRRAAQTPANWNSASSIRLSTGHQ